MMITAAFMIGLLGSLHCLGMCGPIALALPVRTTNRLIKLYKYLVYNFGRILTYASLGLIIGFVGRGFAIAGLQEIISISTGVLIIASVAIIHNPLNSKFLNRYTATIKASLKSAFQIYFKRTGIFSLFILGVLNGLLPCGMVYMAMLGALATGSSIAGAGFMAAFGLGTVPMMLSVSLMGNIISERVKSIFLRATPILACMIGVLLIVRGLSLNIPYISPGPSCCYVQSCH
jgi:sulfite exporter TauE/SafE